jgi:similar to spore coat protein
MNTLVENLTGMNTLTDEVIAYDFLLAAKSGVTMLAAALTETATPEIRQILRGQLQGAIDTHEQITNYMLQKGWYLAYDLKGQIALEMKNANTALQLAKA